MALEAESLVLDQSERTADYLPSGFAEKWFLDANWYPGPKMLVWHCAQPGGSLDSWKTSR